MLNRADHRPLRAAQASAVARINHIGIKRRNGWLAGHITPAKNNAAVNWRRIKR